MLLISFRLPYRDSVVLFERRVLLGLMSITVFMSMWMPNTAVATIMGPMVIALSAKMVLPSYHQVPTGDCELLLPSQRDLNPDILEPFDDLL